MTEPPSIGSRHGLAWLSGAVIGGAAGLALGSMAYLLLGPVLESASGPIRELQGLSWNVVPGLTVLGGVGGALRVPTEV
ncbi:MAG: hypothetical protein HIU88_03705 [Acidobacteria bacterium]|nr:hypothetical protein [Acidobacteriota bacterium]